MSAVPKIDIKNCSGCGRCVAACSLHLITLKVSGFRKTALLANEELCNACMKCVKSCLLNHIN